MNYSILWTCEARRDAQEIVSWVKSVFGNKAAEEVYEKIFSGTELLSYMPFSGITYASNSHYRVLRFKLSSIYYRINNDTIVITGVFDNRRDNRRIATILSQRK